MSVLAPAAPPVALEPAMVEYDPVRDKAYRQAKLGRDVVDWLAWLELGGASSRTLDQYERDLSRGALLFPSKGIADLTDGDAIQIAKVFKSGERRVRVAAWRSFYKWGIQTRRVTVNPFDVLPAMKQQRKVIYDVFTDPEIAALAALPIRDAALMQIMIDAGARKGDCRSLQLQHYRPEATLDAPYGMVIFREGKGGNDRQVQATQALAQKLQDLVLLEGLKATDYLWYSEQANATTRRVRRTGDVGEGTFSRWWYRCLAAAGVRATSPLTTSGGRNPHLTRHTFATRWLRRGGRLTTLSVAMGHASIKTTFDLYGHLDTRDVGADLILIEGGVSE